MEPPQNRRVGANRNPQGRLISLGALCCVVPLMLGGCRNPIEDALNRAFGPPKTATISGYVAREAAVVGASVEVRCLDGAEFAATTDRDGRYAITIPRDLERICSFRASGGAIGGAPNTEVYFGTATATFSYGDPETLHLTPLTTLDTALVNRVDPAARHAGFASRTSGATAHPGFGGNRAAANALALTGFDPSRLVQDLDVAYRGAAYAPGFAPRDGDPVAELLRAWGLFLQRQGLRLGDVLDVAIRDGHLLSLGPADAPAPGALRFARAVDGTEADRTSCLRAGGSAVAFLNTCDESLWVLACPQDRVTSVTAPDADADAFCRIPASGVPPSLAFTPSVPRLTPVGPLEAPFRGPFQSPVPGDPGLHIAAACRRPFEGSTDFVPSFVAAPVDPSAAFTFACRSGR